MVGKIGGNGNMETTCQTRLQSCRFTYLLQNHNDTFIESRMSGGFKVIGGPRVPGVKPLDT